MKSGRPTSVITGRNGRSPSVDNSHINGCSGFKLVELLVVVAVLAVAALIGLKVAARRFAKSPHANCVNNLKQVGLSFRLWAYDHDGKYPMQLSTNHRGTSEWSRSVVPHFAAVSNELGTPKILLCFADSDRRAASGFQTLTASNISYFLTPDGGGDSPQLWLAGDRDLSTNHAAILPGLVTIDTNTPVRWAGRLHKNEAGNVLFRDGHVERLSKTNVQTAAAKAVRALQSATTNSPMRMLIP